MVEIAIALIFARNDGDAPATAGVYSTDHAGAGKTFELVPIGFLNRFPDYLFQIAWFRFVSAIMVWDGLRFRDLGAVSIRHLNVARIAGQG